MSELLAYILANEESFRRARLPSLYSDFSTQRYTNPDGYEINITAWQRALAHAALAGVIHASPGGKHNGVEKTAVKSNLLVLRVGDALMEELETTEWGRPVALQSAIDEAMRSNSMIPLDTFQMSSTSPFKSTWLCLPSPPTISQVMGWSMRQIKGFLPFEGNSDGSEKLQTMNLVLVDNLKEVAKRVIAAGAKSHMSNTDYIYSKELFTKQFADILGGKAVLSNLDFDVLLIFLSRDENAIIYDGETIKFESSKNNTKTITHEDRTIASLKTLISNLSGQVANLESKIKELSLRAKNAVADKNRVVALSALRSKKMAENNLKRRTDTLLQLEEVYMKLEQATDQIDIVRVMQASTGVLRSLHAQVGGVEMVEDAVEELREEMARVDEIGNIINEVGPAIDEGELDDELVEMEAKEQEARETKEAEATRWKLAELEQLGKPAAKVEAEAQRKAEQEYTASSQPVDYDSDLEDSIGKLSQMSIEDTSKTLDTTAKEPRQVPAK
ncbi:uncharacterized protein PADG_01046 [Paracoccidioides brasiliensis Pb18]|uniref:SNF7 family protein n=1 Tax=Paracoccidioides brasiliensis (strain Pb18) TaxID=502780 RepID=C1FZ20_PARBD|nr:uncharacterized protein PADG_01046 [Paracoccidioides brasiliensis Pb18]EEH44757.1 hypothetical protein PADG_01046 [Paracoccidioides brasiliensis Pb18]